MPRKASSLMLIAFLMGFINLSSSASLAASPNTFKGTVSKPASSLIGNAYPKGEVRVFLAGQWLKLDGIFPVAMGEVFSTSRGTISFLFTDGTRMDLDGDSAVSFRGGQGGGRSYVIALIKGRIGINGGGLSKFAVLTPDNLMMSPGTSGFTGGLFFYGGRTMVKTQSGALVVKKGTAKYASMDSRGEDIDVASDTGASGAGSAGGAGAVGAGGSGSVAEAAAIGGAMVAGTIAGVSVEQGRGWNEASPYRP